MISSTTFLSRHTSPSGTCRMNNGGRAGAALKSISSRSQHLNASCHSMTKLGPGIKNPVWKVKQARKVSATSKDFRSRVNIQFVRVLPVSENSLPCQTKAVLYESFSMTPIFCPTLNSLQYSISLYLHDRFRMVVSQLYQLQLS